MTNIPIARSEVTMPAPPTEKQNGGDDQNVIEQAALMVSRFKQEREKLQASLTEAILTIGARKREIETLTLERETLRNNLIAMQSTCDELKQEASDLRAFFSSVKAQLDHFEIPLPIRKRANHKPKAVI